MYEGLQIGLKELVSPFLATVLSLTLGFPPCLDLRRFELNLFVIPKSNPNSFNFPLDSNLKIVK